MVQQLALLPHTKMAVGQHDGSAVAFLCDLVGFSAGDVHDLWTEPGQFLHF